jgi:hypothetical protein
MKKSFYVVTLFLLAMLLPPTGNCRCDSSYDKDIMGLIGLVGAAIGVYGIGQYCGLWDDPSDEETINTATQQLRNGEHYQPMLTLISNYGSSFDPQYTFDESLLYQLALAKRSDGSYDAFSSTLNSFMRKARSTINRLGGQSAQIKESGDWQKIRSISYVMDDLHSRLSVMIENLHLLHVYLERHAGYFRLFEYEDYVRNRYYDELQLLDRYTDAYTIKEGLRACALRFYHGPFALMQLVQELNKDTQCLQNLISRTTYNYATRIAYARDVAARLYHLERVTVSDNEYMRTLLAYQQYQKERDFIRAGRC